MTTRSILDRLDAGEVLLMDGGTGTELQRRGVSVDKGVSTEPRPYTSSKGVKTQEALGVWSAAANVEVAQEWKEMGAQIIGGCCASGPEHIEAIAPVVKGA